MPDHDPSTCDDVTCETCLAEQRRESVVRLETALLELETSEEGQDGEWVELRLTVDALDVRNVLDLLRD